MTINIDEQPDPGILARGLAGSKEDFGFGLIDPCREEE